MRTLIFLLLLAFPPPSAPAQKTQEPLIRVRSDLIELRVVVTDRQGKAVAGLTKEDFQLGEDRQPQEIRFFSATQLPERSERSASYSALIEQSAPPDRSIILFVDDLHLPIASLMILRQSLKNVIRETISAQDMVAMVVSGKRATSLDGVSVQRDATKPSPSRSSDCGSS